MPCLKSACTKTIIVTGECMPIKPDDDAMPAGHAKGWCCHKKSLIYATDPNALAIQHHKSKEITG